MVSLSEDQRQLLLRTARRSIETYLSTSRRLVVDHGDPALQQPAGAFVTLHAHGQLRGCIGTFDAREPLIDTVARMAVAAATGDPRFAPVTSEEVPELQIEISVLSPRRPATASELVVGQHGVYIRRGEQHGVLLPQVAIEHGWDAETFLSQTCRKAGLPAHSWHDPQTTIELFTAQVFGEPLSG